MDADPFRVVYTTDNWATKNAIDARVVGRPGAFADIPTPTTAPADGQPAKIIFTLFWPGQNRWLGSNVEVAILAEMPTPGTAAEKPRS
jgi:glucoamylase